MAATAEPVFDRTSKPKTSYQQLAQIMGNDPVRFAKACWPQQTLYTKQQEILYSVRDNIQTFVHAANQMGKSRIAAVTAIWFYASRTPCRVVTTSASNRQLESILWSEINHLLDTSVIDLPFRVVSLKVNKYKTGDRGATGKTIAGDYLIGHVPKDIESFQGHHLPNDKPRVLFIYDESSGIPDEFKEASESQQHRTLCIGNPLNTINFFYRACDTGDVVDPADQRAYDREIRRAAATGKSHPGRPLRLLSKVIHIDGQDSPNVQLGQRWEEEDLDPETMPLLVPGLLTHDEYLQREELWDDVKRWTRLRGHFYEGEEALMFPKSTLDVACSKQLERELEKMLGKLVGRTPNAMGLDVAEGRDETVWTLIDEWGVTETIEKHTTDTTVIFDITVDLIKRYGIHPSRVAIDAGGGKAHIDRLRKANLPVQAVFFGESPGKSTSETKQAQKKKKKLKIQEADPVKTYKNRRAEMYGELCIRMRNNSLLIRARAEDTDFDLSEDMPMRPFLLPHGNAELRRQLKPVPVQYDDEGRLFLPPKDLKPGEKGEGKVTMKKLLGCSPDRSDSLVLAYHAWRTGIKRFDIDKFAELTEKGLASDDLAKKLLGQEEKKPENPSDDESPEDGNVSALEDLIGGDS